MTFDAPKTRLFLAAIRRIPSVWGAAKAAKVSRSIHYKRLKADPEYAAAFKRAWDEGCEYRAELLLDQAELLEARLFEHALDGVAEPVIYQGSTRRVWNGAEQRYEDDPLFITKWDHTLMWNLLKAAKPDKYRERTELSGEITFNLAERLIAAQKRIDDEPEAIRENAG